MDHAHLRENIYKSLLSLFTPEGIYASSRQEVYGCIFGRDSAITILKILKVCSNKSSTFFQGSSSPRKGLQDVKKVLDKSSYPLLERDMLIEVCRRSLLTLVNLQGKEKNIESGEEPGKFIHEYRTQGYERLVNRKDPWYVYPDGILRNYDSIDSTPLTLIAIYKFWELTQDNDFLKKALGSVEKGLEWLVGYADLDNDYLIEYEFHKERKHGGLKVQSWTDSHESIQAQDGKMPQYPIAPVEVQGYAWLALRLWQDYYNAVELDSYCQELKKTFNKMFIFKDEEHFFPAQALDGRKNQIKTITGNPLLLLWASHAKSGKIECILENKYVEDLVDRSFENDLYDNDAGIRTMSSLSSTYNSNQDSYHNGSFWPKLNGMAHEGLQKWGYAAEADKLKTASLKPLFYFGTPIELYIKQDDNSYLEYRNSKGQVSCREQAWSAAVALDLLTI